MCKQSSKYYCQNTYVLNILVIEYVHSTSEVYKLSVTDNEEIG